MKSELIVDVQPQEIAIALTEDDRLQEVNREKRDQDNFAVGNIYYGRVKKVMPALNAVFVDVGHEKEAFLHYLDLGSQFRTLHTFVTKAVSDRRRMPVITKTQRQPEVGKEGQIADVLKVGDTLLVQVSKEPINTKGPRLTAEISIAGRNIVLIPFADGVMVSQKIKREAERQRLKQLLLSIKPAGFGIIVRTVAEDKRAAELDSELRLLMERWQQTIKSLQQKEPVSLVSEEMGRTLGIIRDVLSPDFTSIQVNDKDIYEDVRNYLELIAPESAKIVKLYKGEQPIFDHFDITRQMKTGLGRTVGFKHGGYLIIDKTEALFSIDVNSGSKKIYEDQEENAYQFNMLAADELVHQLRLRDIGGIIIVDFIDMDSKEHQQQLYDYVRKLMDRDRAKHNVLPLSKFGLMQITRQRVRPAVEMPVEEVCPTCMGKGKIQASLLFTDKIAEECEQEYEKHGRGLKLHLHPFIYAYVTKGWWKSLAFEWRTKYDSRYAGGPGVDGIAVHLQAADHVYHLVDRHAVPQHAGDEFGIIPELAVELITQSFDGRFEAARVDKLEIIPVVAVFFWHLDNLPFCHGFGQGNTHLIVRQAGEDLVRMTVFQTHEGDPFIFLVLEPHDVAFQFCRALQGRRFDLFHIIIL